MLPRSRRRQPSGVGSTSACVAESLASGITTSWSAPRPIRSVRAPSSTVRSPASGIRITSRGPTSASSSGEPGAACPAAPERACCSWNERRRLPSESVSPSRSQASLTRS